MSSGGTQTTTSREQQAYAPYIQDAQQDAMGIGFNMNKNFMQAPGFAVAGMNPDQMRAIDQARLTMLQGNSGERPSVMGMGQAQTHQLGGKDFQEFMNPYLDSVGKSTLGAMNKEYLNTDANLAAKYAGMGSFGGSGAAIARGQAARGHNEASGAAVNQMMSQGYDRGNALAMSNVGMRNDMARFNAGQELNAAQMESGLMDADIRRQIGTQENLMNRGNQQQLFAQTAIDVPMRALERYAALIPQVYNSNTAGEKTSPDNSPNPLMQILGMGAQMAGAYLGGPAMAASDRGMKTDITKLGKDPDTGLDMFAYRYKGDSKEYPKVVGPMAQDVEKAFPGSTREVGGKRTVEAGLLSHLMGKAQ
jgi:hypothetical protein